MRLTLACLALVAVFVIAAPSASADYDDCGRTTISGPYELPMKVKNMTCGNAQRIAHRYFETIKNDYPPARGEVEFIKSFRCKWQNAYYPYRVAWVCRHRTKPKALKTSYPPENIPERLGGSPKPKVGCWNHSFPSEPGATPDFYTAPRKCAILRRGADSIAGGDAIGRGLRWKWGNRRATAKGKLYISSAGFHPGRIKLTKPVVSCGRLVFSKVRARIDAEGVGTIRYGFPIYTC